MTDLRSAIRRQRAYDDNYLSEDRDKQLKALQEYAAKVKGQVDAAQNVASRFTKLADERKNLIQSIDGPTVKEIEQQNPVSTIYNYLPTNPNYTLNWANAFSSAAGNKPAMPTWNANFDKAYNDAMIKRLNDVQEQKTIASIDPEKRTAKDTEKINRFVADKVKAGEWKTAKEVLKAMPENYSLLSPEGKVEVLNNSTKTEQAYLIWKQKKLAKIKEGEEERRKGMNVFEKSVEDADKIEGDDWFSNFKKGFIKTVGSTLNSVYKPLSESAEKYSTNQAKEMMGANPVTTTLNKIGAAVDLAFSVGMAPLNAVTGAAQQSPIADQYNIINNAAMEIMNLPGTGAAKVAEALGVDDPELLQSISSIGNAAVIAALPSIKGRLAKGIETGISKKLSESKNAFDINEAKRMEKAIDPAGALEKQPKTELPIGETVVKEAVKSEIQAKTPEKVAQESMDITELQKRREIADRESSMLLEDQSMFPMDEVAQLKQRVAETGKTERQYAIDKMKEMDELDAQIKTLEEKQKPAESVIKEEETKLKEEEYTDDYDPYTDDIPAVEPKKKVIEEEEPMGNPYDDYEPTPSEKVSNKKSFADAYSDRFSHTHIQSSLAKNVAEAYSNLESRKAGVPEKIIDDFIAHSDRARSGGAMIGEMPIIKELADPEFKKQFKQEMLDDVKREWEIYNDIKTEPAKQDIVQKVKDKDISVDVKPNEIETKAPSMVKVSEIETHPSMQFKANAGEEGVTARDKITAEAYDPKKAGTFLLWKEPETGKTYVVDGHHRLNLAKEKNAESVPAYYSEAKSLTEARAEGAINNIANGKGSAVDVARFMKEKGFTADDLKRNNITVKDGTAAKRGVDLSELNNELLDRVEKSTLYDKTQETISNELLPEKYGAIIGKEAPIPTELAMKHKERKMNDKEAAEYERLSNIQNEAYKYLIDNPDVKPGVLTEIIKEKMGDKQTSNTGQQASMFGEVVSKFEKERAELRADVERRLSSDLNIAGTAKNQRKAAGLEEKGLGSLNVEEGKTQYENLKRVQEVFQKNKYSKEYSDITNEYAKKLSEAKNANERRTINEEFYNEIRRRGEAANIGREGQNIAITETDANKAGDRTALQRASGTGLRKREDIPLERANAKDLKSGDMYFDKDNKLWTVEKLYDDGSYRAYDGIDPESGSHIRKIFEGDIELKGLNAPETAWSGGLAASQATENALKRTAELEMAKKNIAKDDPKYAAEMDKTLKKTYEDNNFANIEKYPLITKIANKLDGVLNYFKQRYNLDYNDPRQAHASAILRTLEANQAYSTNFTKEAIYHTVKPLQNVKDGLAKFSMYKSLKTIDADIKAGLYDKVKDSKTGQETIFDKEYTQLPNGWTKEYITEQIGKLDKEFAANPYLKAALDNWNDYWGEVTANAVKEGVLPKEVLKNPDYMHKQIKEFYAESVMMDDIGTNFSNPKKNRTGSAKDFNTNWTMATAMVMKKILRDTKTMSDLKRLVETSDIRKELIAKAKESGKKVSDIIPEDYVPLKIDPKSDYAGYQSPLQRWAEHRFGRESFETGTPKEIIVHKNIAKVINDMRFVDKDPLNRAFRAVDKAFKVNVLYNPIRYTKYEMRNAYSDLSKLVMTYPGVFKKVGESFRELKDMSNNKVMASDLAEAYKAGIVDSGMNAKEFRDTFNSFSDKDIEVMFDPSKRGKLEQFNIIKKFYKGSIDFNNFRENMFRLAAYKYFKERTAKGEKVYGASNYKVIDAIKEPNEKAAVLARELLVDYGNSTAVANRFARGVVPFYRWIEGNPKGIVNWVKNIAREDGSMAGKAGKVTVRATAGLGVKAIKYVALSQAMYGAVQLWNRMNFPESYSKLNNTQARRGDLIVWEKDDGTLVTLPLETAVNDFLGYFGLDDWMTDLSDYVYGKKSDKDIFNKMRTAPVNKAVQSALPVPKMILESVAGKSYYDVYNPTPIIDNKRYWAKALQAEPLYKIYKSMTGERLPERNGDASFWYNVIGGSVWNETNVNEIAYNMIRGKGYKYNAEKRGKETPSDKKDEAELALYYMKQAVKYKDFEAEKRFRQKYIDIRKSEGKTSSEIRKAMNTSIKNADPLAMISKKYRQDFINNYLSQYERELLKQAGKYYEETYNR